MQAVWANVLLLVQLSQVQQPSNTCIQRHPKRTISLSSRVHQAFNQQFDPWGVRGHACIPLFLFLHLQSLVNDRAPELPSVLDPQSLIPVGRAGLEAVQLRQWATGCISWQSGHINLFTMDDQLQRIWQGLWDCEVFDMDLPICQKDKRDAQVFHISSRPFLQACLQNLRFGQTKTLKCSSHALVPGKIWERVEIPMVEQKIHVISLRGKICLQKLLKLRAWPFQACVEGPRGSWQLIVPYILSLTATFGGLVVR